MEKEILVSVIVPIYNVEQYVDKCLAQLAKQTLKQIEVIMVNDGSTDRSADIARKYEEAYAHFKLINQANAGLSAARNCGIRQAKGKYLHFCDSDDFIVEDALELLYEKAEAEDLEALRFGGYMFYEEDMDSMTPMGFCHGSYDEPRSGRELLRDAVENKDGGDLIGACRMLIRSSVLWENDIWFYEGILHEDNLFCLQFLLCCQRAAVWRKRLYCVRVREGSITHSKQFYAQFKGYAQTAIEADQLVQNGSIEKEDDWIRPYLLFYISTALELLAHAERIPAEKEYLRIARQLQRILRQYHLAGSKRTKLFLLSARAYLYIAPHFFRDS